MSATKQTKATLQANIHNQDTINLLESVDMDVGDGWGQYADTSTGQVLTAAAEAVIANNAATTTEELGVNVESFYDPDTGKISIAREILHTVTVELDATAADADAALTITLKAGATTYGTNTFQLVTTATQGLTATFKVVAPVGSGPITPKVYGLATAENVTVTAVRFTVEMRSII
jgi:hypothetical protein